MVKWSRTEGYEVSSLGDWRFSAFNAIYSKIPVSREMKTKITAIKGWPFPVYGKISQQTANNILPKKKKEDIVNALLKLRKNKRKVDDALF